MFFSSFLYIQYNIKKREELKKEETELKKQDSVCSEGGLNRKKKTPEEIVAEAEEAELDEFTSEIKSIIEYV